MGIHIVANAATGSGMSGGDRIFIECARHWARKGEEITIYVWEDGLKMCLRNNLKEVSYVLWSALPLHHAGIYVSYIGRTIRGSFGALRRGKRVDNDEVIYSASDFWPDVLPAFFLRLKNPKAKWLAAIYLIRPALPEENGWSILTRLRNAFFILSQEISSQILRRIAFRVVVLSEYDKIILKSQGFDGSKVIVARPGVDFAEIHHVPDQPTLYDACFVGRLHPQKGIFDLIRIWRQVCNHRPTAKLAVMGSGEPRYEERVVKWVQDLGLEENIMFLGFLDGDAKFRVMKSSKLLLFPSHHESFGLVIAEALACELPVITYRLPQIITTFGDSVISTRDTNEFAKTAIGLLDNPRMITHLKQKVKQSAWSYDWDAATSAILDQLTH